MSTTYPTSKQVFTDHVDNDAGDFVDAADVNDVHDTVEGLEDACGYGTTFPTLPGAIWKTFTPTITGSAVAGAGTYTHQHGYYTQIGKLVMFFANIRLTAHTGSGEPRLSLPVTVGTFSGFNSLNLGYLHGIELGVNGVQWVLASSSGLDYANFYVARDNLSHTAAELSTWAYPGGFSDIAYSGTLFID